MSIPAPEEWRLIPGYAGLYEASDQGRVRSLPRTVAFVDGRSRTWPAQMLGMFTWGDNPHLQVNINAHGRKTKRSVHQLILLTFVGPRPEGPDGKEIRHLDGNPLNNALSNLAYGSQSENSHDRVRHGTHQETRKTQCAQGHPFDESNTYRWRGRRICRQCQAANCRRWTERRRELAARVSR